MKQTAIRIPSAPVRTHPIWVGTGLLPTLAKTKFPGSPTRAIVLHDVAVSKLSKKLARLLSSSGWSVELLAVKASERSKSWPEAGRLLDRLLRFGADRHTVLFAVGGGVVGDLGGFVAGVYMRGLRWVSVPTTLLAMVDSGIGGKTAVNLGGGKNLAGLFHQPLLTVCDLDALHTLPEREWLSGIGEVVKYGLACDRGFLERLVRAMPRLLGGGMSAWEKAIFDCAAIKARVVSEDPRDEIGVRDILNFGHTVGHAIESLTGYRRYRHGEAILLGMRAEARISYLMGLLPEAESRFIDEFLGGFPVARLPKGVTASRVFARFARDKKARDGKVRMVLLEGIASPVLSREVRLAHVKSALRGL